MILLKNDDGDDGKQWGTGGEVWGSERGVLVCLW